MPSPIATAPTTNARSSASVPGDLASCCPPLGAAALDAEAAEDLAGIFRALADPVRVRLLSIAVTAEAGEVCACDLPDVVGRSQSTVSHHLSVLVDAGLLVREQRGRWAWFHVDDEVLADVALALVRGARPAHCDVPAAPT